MTTPQTPLPQLATVPDALAAHAARRPDSPALSAGDEQLAYGDLAALVAQMGSRLSLPGVVGALLRLNRPSASAGGSGNVTAIPSDVHVGRLLIWVGLAIVISFAYQRSRFGRRLIASREDEAAARSLGIHVERERRIAFTLSAMITAVAGGLYAHYLGSIGPGSFDLSVTFLIIAMLVVGGMRSLTGAVVGAVVVSAVTTVLNNWEQGQTVLGIGISLPAATTQIAVAAMLVVVLILRPDGLTAGRELRWPGRVRLAARGERRSAVRVSK